MLVAGKACELGENQSADVAAFDVSEHPLCFRVIHHRLSRDTGEVVDFLDRPRIEFGVFAGTLFVVLRTVALGLVFGRDTNPNADTSVGAVVLSSRFRVHDSTVPFYTS